MYVEHHRRSIRLPGFDYTQPGAYFITICTFKRARIFGEIHDGVMHTNDIGGIVLDELRKTAAVRSYVTLDEHVVMPDHFHGIIQICRGTARRAPTDLNIEQFGKPVHGSIPTIIRSFKSAVTQRVHEIHPYFGSIWQRNYYERVIRTDTELNAVRRYIRNNPMKWGSAVGARRAVHLPTV